MTNGHRIDRKTLPNFVCDNISILNIYLYKCEGGSKVARERFLAQLQTFLNRKHTSMHARYGVIDKHKTNFDCLRTLSDFVCY